MPDGGGNRPRGEGLREVPRLRFGKVARSTWGDEKFCSWSAAGPNAQTLWLFLMTGEHNTALPGLFRLSLAAVAERFEWPLEDTLRVFAEITSDGAAHYDRRAGVMWLPNAIRHNEPANPNTVVGWRSEWAEIPECSLKSQAKARFESYLAEMGEQFALSFQIVQGNAKPRKSPNPSGKATGKRTTNNQPADTADTGPSDLPKGLVEGMVTGLVEDKGDGQPTQEKEKEKDPHPPTPLSANGPKALVEPEPVAAAAAGDSDLDEPEPRCPTIEPGVRRTGTSVSELRQRMRERAGAGLDCSLTLVQEIGFVEFVRRAPTEGFCDDDFLALADMASGGEFAKVYENKRELSAMLGWPTSNGQYPAAGLLAALKIAKAWRLKPRQPAQKLTVVPKPAPTGPSLTREEILAEYAKAKEKFNGR